MIKLHTCAVFCDLRFTENTTQNVNPLDAPCFQHWWFEEYRIWSTSFVCCGILILWCSLTCCLVGFGGWIPQNWHASLSLWKSPWSTAEELAKGAEKWMVLWSAPDKMPQTMKWVQLVYKSQQWPQWVTAEVLSLWLQHHPGGVQFKVFIVIWLGCNVTQNVNTNQQSNVMPIIRCIAVVC